MSALVTLRDMQSRPWVCVEGVDTLPIPNSDLNRFYEQGLIEFVTGIRPLNKTAWDSWLAEFDRLGGSAWEQAGIGWAKDNSYLR
jgi:putative aldouronate transport system substrate-binding protein